MVNDWQKMQQAAQDDGLSLDIVSGFRNFERQLAIWQAKASGQRAILNADSIAIDTDSLSELEIIEAIMLYSALPGASRHHWGTDIDVYAANLLPQNYQLQLVEQEYYQGGLLYPLFQWLTKHAQAFNFYLPYQKYSGGIAAEPWHLSHKITAKAFESSLSLTALTDLLATKNISFKETLLTHLPMLYNRFIKIS